ncbi:MAG: hypothetical protein JOY62_00880 [Acidobacteriaceae bacterium]|nr:hypothetical protein [Acidobacteriaceae bacterium]MBV9778500.1 hypothetical protein [Acidobacteriaceae bacterium]
MKILVSTLSLIAVFLLQPSARADEWNKHWNVGPNPELRIDAHDAAVTVEATEGNGIDATLRTRGWSIGPSGVHVIEHQSGNSVEIDVKVPSVHFAFTMHSIELRVRVPRELTANIHTGDGSIRLRGLHGPLRADTGDGSIQGEDLDGTLEANSGDGSVHIAGRFDGLQLHTKDGSVELEVMRGSRMQSEWHVQTGDGSVSVRVPHDLPADLELRTGDGHIHFDLPLSVTGTQSEHEVRGKLNGGGPLLAIRTGDGSISLTPL